MVKQKNEHLSGMSRFIMFLYSQGKKEPEISRQIDELSKNVPKCFALLGEVLMEVTNEP